MESRRQTRATYNNQEGFYNKCFRSIWHKRTYQKGDCTADLCLAATNDPAVNAAVTAECRQKGILVNRCDCREDCDFYFPAVVEHDGVIIGLGSDGSDHKKVKTVASQLRKSLCTPEK